MINENFKSQILNFRKDIGWIIAIIWKSTKGSFIINTILMIVQAILPVASLYVVKLVVEDLIHVTNNPGPVIFLIIIFCLLQVLYSLFTQISGYINFIQQQKLTDYLSQKVLDQAVKVPFEYYENPRYHDTLHLAQVQSQNKASSIVSTINALFQSVLSLFFLVGLFLTINWVYALLFVALSLPLTIVKWYFGFSLYRLEKKYAPHEREAGYLFHLLTNVSFAKEMRLFGTGQLFIKQFISIRDAIFNGKKILNRNQNYYSMGAQLLEAVILICIFTLLVKNVAAGALTVGTFIIYLQGFQRLQSNSKNFFQSLVQTFQLRLFLNDLFTFLNIQSLSKPVKTNDSFNSKLGMAVNNLSFVYPGTSKEVLRNVSLHCNPGEIIAIVGKNSSGKSTLVKLIAGLYEVTKGDIKIYGNKVNEIPDDKLREMSSFLFQDYEKYFFTISENIRMSSTSEPEPKKIVAAAKKATAHDFIEKLGQQYETRLGRTFERTEQLSGGQWQKIAIARLIYKDALIAVMDEPTSSIDAIAENEIFYQLKKDVGNKMILLISHRLYNLKIADRIYVLHEGEIKEQGSFSELLKLNGIFKSMYDNQKL